MSDLFARLLRQCRTSRGWSQERLGLEARVSARHISCLETGKSSPSRDMVVLLARVLELELRDRNTLLQGAGFAPVYPTSPLDSLAMSPIHRAITLLLDKLEPYGALLVDRCWNVVGANGGARRLMGLVAEDLPPSVASNLIRMTLHPQGLRPYIVNWPELASLMLDRVERAHLLFPLDRERQALFEEVRSYPDIEKVAPLSPFTESPVGVLHLRRGPDELRLFAILTTIGTPLDVTAQELTIETFFPADDATERWFRASA